MTVLDALDATGVRAWARLAHVRMTEHRAELDALNVFPVPDSDTGTNLVATLRAGEAAVDGAPAEASTGQVLAAWADGAVRGAIGNSGFIVSQLLQGLAETATDVIDGPTLVRGLAAGAVGARTAVMTPVEGTVLSVAAAVADTVAELSSPTLAEVASRSLVAATEALERTPLQLPALHETGVVDAGGRGLVVLLAALAEVVSGEPHPLPPVAMQRISRTPTSRRGPWFEVQYDIDCSASAVEGLRADLGQLGDSVVVVRAGELWRVHVHVADVGAAIEAGLEVGRASHIQVTDLAGAPAAHDHRSDPAPSTTVVAVAAGGVAELFEHAGVVVVDDAEEPVASAVRDRILELGAWRVVLLPNSPSSHEVDEAAEQARLAGVRVAVIPTRSPVQGLAAAAVHDADRRFDDDVVAMAEAAAATRHAVVTRAEEEALTAVGICHPGDVLGLIDGDVVEIGHGFTAVAFGLIDRLLGVGGELMTVLVDVGAPAGLGAQARDHARGRSPFVDVTVYRVDGLGAPLIIGVE